MTGIMQMFVAGGAGEARGSQTFSSPGTYTWVAPAGVTSVSFVQVGASYLFLCVYPGPSSGGGGLGYQNNWAVTPGTSYTIKVGNPCTSYTGCTCAFGNNVPRANGVIGGAGYRTNGGNGYSSGGGGGGGAGGYTGGGGAGGSTGSNGTAGAGGGGGGGSGSASYCGGIKSVPCTTCGGYVFVPAFIMQTGGGGGGGTGLYGAGASGAGGVVGSNTSGGGGGGSPDGFGGGANGQGKTCQVGGNGGNYGGGGGSGYYYYYNPTCASCFGAVVNYACVAGGGSGTARGGAVRIVWPGATRQFPSTCVGAP